MENRKAGRDRSERLLRWIAMALAFACFLAAGACGGDDSPTPEEAYTDWVYAAEEDPGTDTAAETGTEEAAVANPAGGTPEAAVTEGPAPRVVAYDDAEAVFRARRYGEAMDLFSSYLDAHPGNAWGHYMLGLSAWKAGHPGVAETHLVESVALAPEHVKGRVNLARVLIETGRPGEAMEQAGAAEQMDPSSSVAKRVLARALAESGDWSGAVDKYQDALWIDPHDVWSLNNLGYLFIERGLFDDAIRPLALAVELDSTNATALNNLGSALEGSGFPVAALAAFRSAAQIDPGGKAAASAARLGGQVPPDAVPEVTTSELAGAYREELLIGSSPRGDTVARLIPPGATPREPME